MSLKCPSLLALCGFMSNINALIKKFNKETVQILTITT